MTAGVFDDFGDFRQACVACGLIFAPSDMTLSESIWRRLDYEQRQKAIAGLAARRVCGEYADPSYCPLPQNYLSKRLWERPLRVRKTRQDRLDDFWKAV